MTIWSMEQIFRSKLFLAFYDDEREALDEYHTHFLLFDIGDPYKYLNDTPRSNFVKAACSRTEHSRSLQVCSKSLPFCLRIQKKIITVALKRYLEEFTCKDDHSFSFVFFDLNRNFGAQLLYEIYVRENIFKKCSSVSP